MFALLDCVVYMVLKSAFYVDSENLSKVVYKKEQCLKKTNNKQTPNQKYSFVTSIICLNSVDLTGEKRMILNNTSHFYFFFCLFLNRK